MENKDSVEKIADRVLDEERKKEQKRLRDRWEQEKKERAIAEKKAEEEIKRKRRFFLDATENLRKMLKGDIFKTYFQRLLERKKNCIGLVDVEHGTYTIPGVLGASEPVKKSRHYWLWLNKECDFVFRYGALFGPHDVYLADVPEPVWKEVKKVLIALSKPDTAIIFLKKKFGLNP